MTAFTNYVSGDFSSVFELVNAARLHDGHRPMSREDLQGRLTDPHFDPERCWLAREGGQLLGYAATLFFPYDQRDQWAFLFGVVHPSHRKRGIGTRLMELALRQLGELRPMPKRVDTSVRGGSPDGEKFLMNRGFFHTRRYWQMTYDPRRGTPAASLPDGYTCRNFLKGDEDTLIEIHNRSFASHHNYVPLTSERLRIMIGSGELNSRGVFFVFDGPRVVGFGHCAVKGDLFDVETLGVDPEYRGLGLGRYLLTKSLEFLIGEGAQLANLMVDGENEKATRLYRSLGFETAETFSMYRRLLG